MPFKPGPQLDGPGLVVIALFQGLHHGLVDHPVEFAVKGEKTIEDRIHDVGFVDAGGEERVKCRGVGVEMAEQGFVAGDFPRVFRRFLEEGCGINEWIRVGGIDPATLVAAAGYGQQKNKKTGPHFHVDSLRGFLDLFTALEPCSNLFYSPDLGQISILFAVG